MNQYVIFAIVSVITFIVMVLLAFYLNGYFSGGKDKPKPDASVSTRRRAGGYSARMRAGGYSARMR
jgi:hypothetical protein